MIQRIKEMFRIWRAIVHARRVQEVIWGDVSHVYNKYYLEQLVPVLEKRIDKLYDVSDGSKHWRVETRKRLLQSAAVSIALLETLDRGNIVGVRRDRII